MRLIFVLIVFIATLISIAAHAQEAVPGVEAITPDKPELTKPQQLDQLLAKLHTAPDNADVSRIEDQIWQIWSRNDSPTAEVLLRQSSAAITNGEFEPAEIMLTQALETYPTYAEAWNRRASLYYLQKRYDVALIDVDHALALEPRNFGALIGKGLILRAQKRDDDAEAAFEDALAINPHLDSVAALLKKMAKERPKI